MNACRTNINFRLNFYAVSKANKCDLPPLECTEETCEVPHKPLPELEVVKVLDEWEVCKIHAH